MALDEPSGKSKALTMRAGRRHKQIVGELKMAGRRRHSIRLAAVARDRIQHSKRRPVRARQWSQ